MSLNSASVPEAERLAKLDSYNFLDNAYDSVLNNLVILASKLTESPIALISFLDAKRQFIKYHVGFIGPEKSIPLDQSICVHVLRDPLHQPMVVSDALADPRFTQNPWVTGAPYLRSYSSAPLISPDGHFIGTLCVLDTSVREFSQSQNENLASLAKAVSNALELQRTLYRTRELALTDALTGLSNRRAFIDAVNREIAQQSRAQTSFGLIYLDLDGFKEINDRYGHQAGDKVLREVANAMSSTVQQEDLVARLGGDEFAILSFAADTEATAGSIQRAVKVQMQSWGWPVTASIGAVHFLSAPENELDAIMLADEMMYSAKNAGKDQIRYRQFGLEPRIPYFLKTAGSPDNTETTQLLCDHYFSLLNQGCLETYFMPVISLCSGKIVGVEALARLIDGQEVVLPDAFLPKFSRTDQTKLLINVLEQGLQFLVGVGDIIPNLRLSLNIEPALLTDNKIIELLLGKLREYSIDPKRIVLEVLEVGEITNIKSTLRQINILRKHGIKIALDDVGSGYSSLLRLKELPVDIIKLDQAFVRDLKKRPDDLIFVSSIMSLAQQLDIILIVEGAESEEIVDSLSVLGVEYAQGFAIARPMPKSTFMIWMRDYQPVAASRQPKSILGAYAAHLNLVKACRALLNQPLAFQWPEEARDPHACLVGKYLDEIGLHDTPLGHAHKDFHAVLPECETKRSLWNDAAKNFEEELQKSIKAQ